MVSPGAADQGELLYLKYSGQLFSDQGEWDEAHHQNKFIYKEKLSKYKMMEIVDFLKNLIKILT